MAQGSRNKDKRFRKKEKPEFDQKLLDLARVTRVVKGGRRFRFRATLVIGNRKGRVGVGVAKGSDVSDAITKAYAAAKKKMVEVSIEGNTIPHDISYKLGSAKIILKPAIEGRGLIAGGSVRAVVDLAGIRDIVSKSLGTSNKINVARATIAALEQLQMIKKTVPVVQKKEVVIEEEKKTVQKPAAKKVAKKAPAKKVLVSKKKDDNK